MKKVLVICPYDKIYPPMNGGMQRCFHVLHQLSKHFELTAIINQDKENFLKSVKEFPAIESTKIYSTKDVVSRDVFNIFPPKLEKTLRYRWYKKQLNGPADGNLLLYYPILKQLLKKQKFDVIILESLATLNAVSVIRKYDRYVKIIYDAHNVDTNLAKAAHQKKEITRERFYEIQYAESNLNKMVNAIFTCSQKDKDDFLEMNNGKLIAEVVPNGVNIPQRKYDDAVNARLNESFGQEQIPRNLIFCGSLWSIPNAEGLHWFCKKIWPLVLNEIPDLKLLVVGNGELPKKRSEVYDTPSVEFAGAVDDVKPWYNKAAVSVVPLITGSGTRLKILEAMSLGIPVISTTIGAEGITYTNNKNIIIADEEKDFAEKVIHLLKNKEKRLSIQQQSRKLVEENYDWNIIGSSLSNFLNS